MPSALRTIIPTIAPPSGTASPILRDVWPTSRLVAERLVRRGFGFSTCYPGSPIAGIADELRRMSDRRLCQFRYATNEKVAFEMAAAVAIAGGRAVCLMKHVGVNVALDAIMAIGYTGHSGALLLVVGDDPGCDSSSNEQDSRLLARLVGVPCVEPSSPADVCAALDRAADLSEQLQTLVFVRLTTDVAYSGSTIAAEEATEPVAANMLQAPTDRERFILLPSQSRKAHVQALDRLAHARDMGNDPAWWNESGDPGDPRWPGFIVQNSIAEPFRRACQQLGVSPDVWRTFMPWPLTEAGLLPFLDRHDRVIVVEELETVLEDQVVAMAARHRLSTRIEGGDLWPRHGRLDEARLLAVVGALLKCPELPATAQLPLMPMPRPPTFCPGCPHTASIHAIKSVIESLPERPFIASDIGCYTLATKPGLEVGDVVLSMGSSLGIGTGLALAGMKTIALIGDSTFLHAGLPALQNAVVQKVDLVVCIFDNAVSGMTGGQQTGDGETRRLSLAAMGLGATRVEEVDPFDTERMQETLRRFLAAPGVNVLIARSPCALTLPPKPRRPVVDLDKCTGCGVCVTHIHCPAISLSAQKKFQVNTSACVGCGFCTAICPEKAISPEPFPALS